MGWTKGKKRPKFSKEHNENLAKSLRGRKLSESHRMKIVLSHLGKVPSEETRRKLAEKTIQHNQKTGKWWSIGTNETRILDERESLIGFKIQRQVQMSHYIVDGYCPENNTVYEVYESGHKRQRSKIKDAQREKDIREKFHHNLEIIWDCS